jgi:hypothetical protein
MRALRPDVVLAILAALPACAASPFTPPPELVGHWRGEARIIVTWCEQDTLAVDLTIETDGSVQGRVGDATLAEGRLEANRGTIGRSLNLKTDYIVSARLVGAIVAAEGIAREQVLIPVNHQSGRLVGGLHTSGNHVGGKADMVLSAADLVLEAAAR